MYSFRSNSKKRREKRLFLVCLTPSLLFLILSALPQTPSPMLCRILFIMTATGAVWIASRYLLRRYCYCVALCEDRKTIPDLIVTEYYCNRARVVCRISLDHICEVSRQKSEKDGVQDGAVRKFFYTDEIWSPFFCYLTLYDEDVLCCVRILADDRLYNILTKYR